MGPWEETQKEVKSGEEWLFQYLLSKAYRAGRHTHTESQKLDIIAALYT